MTTPVAPDTDHHAFVTVCEIARRAVTDYVTPGLQLSVRWLDGDGSWRAWDHVEGRLHYAPDAPKVTASTLYDLASITKAVVALSLVRIAARGEISLTEPVKKYLPECSPYHTGSVSLEALCAHRGELPAWKPFYLSVTPEQAEAGGTRDRILAEVVRTAREPSAGEARYSDVGYILLGEALSRAKEQSLTEVVCHEVTAPLGLERILHYRGVNASFHDPTIAPTEHCPWRRCLVQGRVHDENAYALEGVAGHAGLFGTATALAELGRASLQALLGDPRWFPPDAMAAMVAPRPGGSHRLGWDGKSPEGSSAGSRTSPRTFGHLGFTGTSLWCDPDVPVAIALVTNRVHPTRNNPAIRALRIAIHDAVMDALARLR